MLLNFIFYKNENTADYIHETKCFTSVKVDMTGMGKDKILNINIGIEDTFEDLCAIASLQDESKDFKINYVFNIQSLTIELVADWILLK